MKTPDDLFGAARLVDAYAAQLKPTSVVCEYCKLTKWSDLEDHQTKIELQGVAKKLRRIAANERNRKR